VKGLGILMRMLLQRNRFLSSVDCKRQVFGKDQKPYIKIISNFMSKKSDEMVAVWLRIGYDLEYLPGF